MDSQYNYISSRYYVAHQETMQQPFQQLYVSYQGTGNQTMRCMYRIKEPATKRKVLCILSTGDHSKKNMYRIRKPTNKGKVLCIT